MERKYKIMSLYIGLLFFFCILLILITSLSYEKINPSYNVEDGQRITLSQSVSELTEENQQLNDRVIVLTERLNNLTRILEEKENALKSYETKNNTDTENLFLALKLYVSDDAHKAKEILEGINKENLDEENAEVFEKLLGKLN